MRSRRGFTLIELLVVIAIIAILAAILFPVFAKARAKARQSACNSNLKQLGLAFLQYTSDYDGQFPGMMDVNGNAVWDYPGDACCLERDRWVNITQPYMKNRDIVYCPTMMNDVPLWGGRTNNPPTSYKYKHACATYGWKDDAITRPAQIYLLIEHKNWHSGTLQCLCSAPTGDQMHNMVFFDGHAKVMSKSRAAMIIEGRFNYWDPHWLQVPNAPGALTADPSVGYDFS